MFLTRELIPINHLTRCMRSLSLHYCRCKPSLFHVHFAPFFDPVSKSFKRAIQASIVLVEMNLTGHGNNLFHTFQIFNNFPDVIIAIILKLNHLSAWYSGRCIRNKHTVEFIETSSRTSTLSLAGFFNLTSAFRFSRIIIKSSMSFSHLQYHSPHRNA
jgi:hypothetical protein